MTDLYYGVLRLLTVDINILLHMYMYKNLGKEAAARFFLEVDR